MVLIIPFLCTLFFMSLVTDVTNGTTTAGCTTGKYEECQKAEFVPGHNLGGEGFDITTLSRKGAYVVEVEAAMTESKSCTLCKNELMNYRLQKLPHTVVDWQALPKCDSKISSKLFKSSFSFAESNNALIENDWSVELGVMPKPGADEGVVWSGSHSKLNEFMMNLTSRDEYSYITQEVECKVYSYRIRDKPELKEQFHEMLKSLPTTYTAHTKPQYQELIDIYGTHYIRKVELGGRVKDVTAVKTCEVALDGMTNDEVKDCLGVEAHAVYGPVKASAKYNECHQLKTKNLHSANFSEKYSERISDIIGGNIYETADLLFPSPNDKSAFKTWLSSLPEHPGIVHYSLSPLSKLVYSDETIKNNLAEAITEYITEKAIIKRCPPCMKGSYTSSLDKCNCTCHCNAEVSVICCSKNKGTAEFTMVIERAFDLYGDPGGNTDGFVEVTFGSEKVRTPVVDDNNNPQWHHTFDFCHVNLQSEVKVKVAVHDADPYWDDFLGECTKSVVPKVIAYLVGKSEVLMTQCESRMVLIIPFLCTLFFMPLVTDATNGAIIADCTTGNYEECQKAEFVPGYNLGGEGFDITTLSRKGAYVVEVEAAMTKNKTCTLCKNELMKYRLQKLPHTVVDWHVFPKCGSKISSKVFESSFSFAESNNALIDNDWSVGLGVLPKPGADEGVVLSGSHSKLNEFAMNCASRDKYSYITQEAECKVYRYNCLPVCIRSYKAAQIKLAV
ncbi:perforin-1-like [Protopterus annectens]|uniref:perforin-1-like n=1 Tax=Protopterus annectens TaxID=7888 RepID=UPI001CFA88DC|nr:perforin-1-like [Protopterus annectens]